MSNIFRDERNDVFARLRTGKIALPTNDGIVFIKLEDVMYVKSDGNYSSLYLRTGKKFLVSRSMADFETRLQGFSFFRTHRCYIVNLKWIQKYCKGRGGYIIMDDGSSVEVSVRKRDLFLEVLDRYFC